MAELPVFQSTYLVYIQGSNFLNLEWGMAFTGLILDKHYGPTRTRR